MRQETCKGRYERSCDGICEQRYGGGRYGGKHESHVSGNIRGDEREMLGNVWQDIW